MPFTIEEEKKRIKRISSGVVILRQSKGQWQALVLRAWSHWDFPKGNVEPNESLIEAAVREVKEETGISDLQFPWGKNLARTSLYSKDKVAYYAIATSQTVEVLIEPNPLTGLKEHDEYRWVPWEQLPSLLSPRLYGILQWVAGCADLPPHDAIHKEGLTLECSEPNNVPVIPTELSEKDVKEPLKTEAPRRGNKPDAKIDADGQTQAKSLDGIKSKRSSVNRRRRRAKKAR